MKVTADGQVYEVDLSEGGQFKLSYREGVAIEKATGKAFSDLDGTLESAGAIIWTLVRRQAPDVSFDAIDFDLEEFSEESGSDEEPVDPTKASTSSSDDAPGI